MSKKKIQIVGGMTQQSYHTIPDDKDLIITSPKKESIFKFLSQISYKEFPEFVKDILVKVEKYTISDITDGPGDEKQDILVTNTKGQRCLIQCKHSEKIGSHYSGDELDRIVAACLRKGCQHAIFVTNTDLTPQAKGYITDKRFQIGWPDKENPIIVEYWNDAIIWDKIQSCTDILNKWFGNLGQTNGLRNFKLEISLQNLPIKKRFNSDNHFKNLLNTLLDEGKIERVDNRSYTAQLSKKIKLHIEEWFLLPHKLNLNYALWNTEGQVDYSAQHGLGIEVIIADKFKYSPDQIVEDVVNYLFKDIKQSELHKWWHILASEPKGFIFLHDIGETRQIILSGSRTFVKINDAIFNERNYVSLDSDHFTIKSEDDDSIYIHKLSGVRVMQMFEEIMNPVEVYQQQIFQLSQLEKFKNYTFKAIDGIESSMMMRIRQIIDPTWVALQHGEDAILWGMPQDVNEESVKYVESKLKALGLQVLTVKDELRDQILESVRSDVPPPTVQFVSDPDILSFPVNLASRAFWLYKDLPEEINISIEKALRLLEFKWYFEGTDVINYADGQGQIRTHTSELPNLLFDVLTFRGSRMFDIALHSKPYSVHVRFRENKIGLSNSLVLEYVEFFNKVYTFIEKIIVTDEVIDFEELGIKL